MHVFFDTVWKLHIGEIPEKPKQWDYESGGDPPIMSAYVDPSYYDALDSYNEAIAAIKQNALAVQNPELIPVFPKPHINGFIIPKNFKPGEFYKWVGGYETKEKELWTSEREPASCFTTVAILTLPEEKKNTMENFTKEDLSDDFNAGATRMYHDLNLGNGNPPEFEQWFEKFSLYQDHPTTSSGSVAAPKEGVTLGVGDGSGQHFVSGSYDTIKLLQGKLIELESYRLSYTFEEDGETGLSLLDRLTPPGDSDISRGRDEIQLLAEEIELHYSKELASLRQQLKEREEALKELLPIVERKFNGISIDDAASHREYIALKAIIERTRKLISK